MIDMLEKCCNEYDCLERLLQSAISEFELQINAEVHLVPLDRLGCVDLDSLGEIGDPGLTRLIRAITKTMSTARMVQLEKYTGHGEVLGSSIAISMTNEVTEKEIQDCWCHASSAGSMHVGLQTWKFRIDHIPPSNVEGAWMIELAVVSGHRPKISLRENRESLLRQYT
eukprot:TRINITY_DN39200_c0_g1_i1.p1 TRINITY_DN39200_c0_g1~~TRINITY_DN39200_c0_g1_i1.p1  ORF type:complete len:169 (+),score=20.19 TRINITY_DN39200_c0_g1_i1:463-969(+)